jgi:hypothetical protein
VQPVRQAVLLHPRIHALDPADLAYCQVRRGVVTGDDHLHQHVTQRRLQTRVVIAKDPGPAANVTLRHRDPFVERQRSAIRLLIGHHEHRKLDDARAIERLVRLHAGFLSSGEVLDPQASLPREAGDLGIEQPLQTAGGRRLRTKLDNRRAAYTHQCTQQEATKGLSHGENYSWFRAGRKVRAGWAGRGRVGQVRATRVTSPSPPKTSQPSGPPKQ